MAKFKSGTCWSCEKTNPLQGHHIAPVELGGKQDGKLANICASCHSLLHREADVYYAHGKFQELDSIVPPTNNQNTFSWRIRWLIAQVILQRQIFDAGKAEVDEARHGTIINWDSKEELLIAHDVKRRLGFKSLDRAMKHLVFQKYQELMEK